MIQLRIPIARRDSKAAAFGFFSSKTMATERW